jgi:hypothetical protein
MAWPKGKPRAPNVGRRAGTPNKAETIRNVTMAAFDELGGKAYLVRIGNENPAVFVSLLGRILPHELATSGGALKAEVLLRWMTPEMARNRGYIEATAEEAPEAVNGTPPGTA